MICSELTFNRLVIDSKMGGFLNGVRLSGYKRRLMTNLLGAFPSLNAPSEEQTVNKNTPSEEQTVDKNTPNSPEDVKTSKELNINDASRV